MNVFAICSSINASNKGVFNAQTRFDQTLRTIESIRRHNQQSFIVLCENSELDQDQKSKITPFVDLFTFTPEISNSKSKNEARQMIQVINEIKNIDYRIVFKISGRYYLNDNFDFKKFDNNQINFREFNWSGRHCFSTVLYSFSKNHEDTMNSCYEKYINENLPCDIETEIYNMLGTCANRIENLGVSGIIAPSGEYIEH